MSKHFFFLISLSMIAVFFKTELAFFLHGALYVHQILIDWFNIIFSGSQWGQLIELAIVLFIMPVIAGVIIAGIFWLLKRSLTNQFINIIWILWFVLLTALVLQGS